MGAYFAKRFLDSGYQVTGSDVKGRGSPAPYTFARSNAAAVDGADLVLVAVPIRETKAVVREVAPHLKSGCTLVEISSVKGSILPELIRVMKESRGSLLSLHPLFGPATAGVRPKACVIGSRRDLSTARRFFPGMTLFRMTMEEHDREMGYVLTLVHVLNLAFAATITRGLGTTRFGRSSTPTSAKQLELAKSVLSQDPSLYSYIETENPSAAEAVDFALAELQRLKKTIARRDARGFERDFSDLARRLSLP